MNAPRLLALILATSAVFLAVGVATAASPPSISCTGLTDQANGSAYTFTAKGAAQNGAAISSYRFDYGDHQSYVTGAPKQNPGSATVQHTYAKSGNYTATVTISATAAGKTITSSCDTQVTLAQESDSPLPGTGGSTIDELFAAALAIATFIYSRRRQATIKNIVFKHNVSAAPNPVPFPRLNRSPQMADLENNPATDEQDNRANEFGEQMPQDTNDNHQAHDQPDQPDQEHQTEDKPKKESGSDSLIDKATDFGKDQLKKRF